MATYAVVQSLVWALVRYLSDDMSTETLFFFRNLIGFGAVAPLLIKGGLGMFKTQRLQMHFLRAFAAFAGGVSVFYAVAHAPLATVVAITYTAPIFASLFAMLILREGVTPARLIVLAAGFVGTMMVSRPSFEMESAGLIAAIISAIATAMAFLTVKQLSSTERPETIVTYPFLFILPVSAILAYSNWTPPSLADVPLLILMGVGFTTGQLFMTKAFGAADASTVLPIDFLRLVVAALIGVVVFGEMLDQWVLFGASIILAAAVYGTRKEKAAQAASAKS